MTKKRKKKYKTKKKKRKKKKKTKKKKNRMEKKKKKKWCMKYQLHYQADMCIYFLLRACSPYSLGPANIPGRRERDFRLQPQPRADEPLVILPLAQCSFV